LYTPPSLRGTVEMPGHNGGGNWGGAAADPAAGLLYVESKDLPTYIKLGLRPANAEFPDLAQANSIQQGLAIYTQNCAGCHGADRAGQPGAIPALTDVTARFTADQIKATVRGGQGPMPGFSRLSGPTLDALIAYLANRDPVTVPAAAPTPTPAAGPQRYWAPYDFLLASNRLSVIGPPWSHLTAYDLNTGDIKWQAPLGEVTAIAAQGHTDTGSHFPRAGLVVTGGGLIFSATTSDRKFRAYDRDTGKVIWETSLEEAAEGVPAVYEVGGREYIVLCVATGNGIMGGPSAQKAGAYVAYALPRR
jgi:quinoprotein glucose dehydrogenase